MGMEIRKSFKHKLLGLPRSLTRNRLASLSLAILIIASVLIPLGEIYSQYLATADGSNRLFKKEQPKPLANKKADEEKLKAKENLIASLREKHKSVEKKDNREKDSLKEEAVTEDPIKSYFDNEEKKKTQKPTTLEDKELASKRTVNTRTYQNDQGGETKRYFSEPVNYEKDGKWQSIKSTLKNDDEYNKKEADKVSLGARMLPGDDFSKKAVKADDGFFKLHFTSLGGNNPNVKIAGDGTSIFSVTPINTNKNINPEAVKLDDGTEFVQYLGAWKNTDLFYEQNGESLKEYIKIHSPDAPNEFKFRVDGAELSLNKDDEGNPDGTILAALPDKTKVLIPELTLTSYKTGPVSNPELSYRLEGSTISIVLDKEWIDSQPEDAFPFMIDPSYTYNTAYRTGIPGGDVGDFRAYKSDGYICHSLNCNMNVGSLNDRGLKTWRTMFKTPFTDVYGKQVIWANIYTSIVSPPFPQGFPGSRTYNATWANCFGYNCVSGAPQASGNIDGDGNLNATALMQWLSVNNVGDGWLIMKANNEGDINSWKAFRGANTYLDVVYQWTVPDPNQAPPLPTLNTPANDATVVVNRPTLKLNPVTDPEGDIVRYAFRVMDSKGNVVAYSPELDTPTWTMPANTLIDGERYSWNVWVLERESSNPSVVNTGWRPSDQTRSFKYSLRTDKDKTQTYDTMGQVNIGMNTGSASTQDSSHSISALGGDIGIGLNYNSPSIARQGLNADYEYYDSVAGMFKSVDVEDPNIDMNWGTASPFPGSISANGFWVLWEGNFIAPQDGTYTFGVDADGPASMTHWNYDTSNLDEIFSTGGGDAWATTSVTLKKGEAFNFYFNYDKYDPVAYVKLKVRTPDNVEQTVPSEWLKTNPEALTSNNEPWYNDSNNQGLSAKFYKNTNPSTNASFIVNDTTPLVFATTVPQVNMNWGSNSLVPADPTNQYTDNMIVNYNGYVTIPLAGNYKFGGTSDNGLRIRLGGNQVVNHTNGTSFSSNIYFDKGQIVPIQVDYYETTGSASVNLQWQGPAGNVIIPGQYLSTTARVVPGGWKVSNDPTRGGYQSLHAKSNGNVELIDSSGFVHVYTNDGKGGYKPPVNEDGYLTRNADATYTFTNVDGTVYTYSADGVISSVSTPSDDKAPSALRYEYQNTAASTYAALPKLSKIIDGVDPTRYGQLYYWGESGSSTVCTTETGFEEPPAGYLCAFKTLPDGAVTKFHYTTNVNWGWPQLARVEKPGNVLTDYGYDYMTNQVNSFRDSLTNDAIMMGIRYDGDQTETEIKTDILGRVSSIEAPAPFPYEFGGWGYNNDRPTHTYEYAYHATTKHIVGDPEPEGYSQYIEYDDLYRTTKACDNMALCVTSVWDPGKDLLLSTTDPLGMMSTNIYDVNDRIVEQYEAAPNAWFGTDRRPLTAYASQVPKNTTSYDEGIQGPAVAWYGAKGNTLFGSPKLHTSGIHATDKTQIGRNFTVAGSVPITTNTTTPGYGFSATGKITFPSAGLYTFQVKNDDGVRLYVDDKLILEGKWETRTAGNTLNTSEATFNAASGKTYRIRLDYIHFDDGTGAGSIDAWLRGPGITDISGTGLGTNKFGTLIAPDYGLATSSSATDFEPGATSVKTTTVKTTYQDPAYGLAASTQLDSTGLNYTSSASYEAQGTGYLRQTAKTLPGGGQTTYAYYGATESKDNPCTSTIDSASQAGRLKLRTDPDPDGTGSQTSRKTENIYDSAGRVVATRVNTDNWTCTTYDVRGRVVTTVVPDKKNSSNVVIRKGSTTTNNFAVGGDPLTTSVNESAAGEVTTSVDLLGRVWWGYDPFYNYTNFTYNNLGRLISKYSSGVGDETISYDDYGRPTAYTLNGESYATVTYDGFGRVNNVEYPQSKNSAGATLNLEQVKRDNRGRSTGAVFRFSDGSSYDETVVLSSAGYVLSAVDKLGSTQATSIYTYDKADRLIQAVIDFMKYDYDYSAPNSTICNQAGTNLNAHKNTNRTKYTATNTTTNIVTKMATYCYNQADQLTKSSDTQIGNPTYDDHGNTTVLSGAGTPINFTYNNLDQNTVISQGNNKVEYTKAPDGTVLRKKEYQNNILTKSYRNLDGGRVLQSCSLTDDSDCTTIDTYLDLPGGVTLTLSPDHPTPERKTVYSIPNFHGDTAVTAGADGLATSSVSLYEPFGQTSPSTTFGTNSNPLNATDRSMGWAADPTRKSESLFSIPIIQMGVRTYLPTLGRFLQVDPVEGGTPNAYTYVGDPINSSDYSGQFGWGKVWNAVKAVARVVVVAAVAVVTAVAAVAAVAATPGIIAGIAVGAAIVAAGSVVAHAANSYGTRNFNSGSMGQAALGGAAIGTFVFGGAAVFAGAASSPTVIGGAATAGQAAAAGAPTINRVTNGINTSSYTYSGTALKSFAERPYQYTGSNLIIQRITTYAPSTTPYKPHLQSWTVPGRFNGSQGVWELSLDPNKQEITHFLFKSLR